MNQPGLNSDAQRSQIFHRDNIEELISNYIQFERRKEQANEKQDQNNNANGYCYGTKFKKSSSYTYGMDQHDNSFMKETMENTKQELAEDYVELAKSYICEKNYDKAEKFLLKAKQLSPAKKIDETLAKLASLSKGPNRRKVRSSLFKDTQGEFDNLLRQTDEQLLEKNLKKAEELLMKAKELNHNERVDILITRLNFLKRQASNEEYLNFSKNANKDEAEKCVAIAKQSIKAQDYRKAEKLLLKAKRLHPDKETDLLLAKLYSMYNQNEVSREDINVDEAERCVQLAEENIAKKNYEKAKKFLLKAKRLCMSIDVNEKLAWLERMLAQQRDENSKDQFSKELNKAEAEKCVNIARSFIDQSNYDKAEKFLKKAKKLCPDLNVEELLQEVSNLRHQRRKSESYFFRVDMNKEEAERCLEMAANYMAQKNFEKARKLLMKAKKLYPMPAIDEAIKKLELLSKPTSTNKKPNPAPSQKQYTKEQEDVVNRILRCKDKDYYEILQVPLGVDVEEVKKAYKNLAKKVHPDKNYAPGAEDAFKRLSRAHEVLSTTPKSSKNSTKEKRESPKPNQNSSTKTENQSQNESSFRKNFFNESYQSSFNNSSYQRSRFNTSFEEKPRPRENHSNHYHQQSNSFNFEKEEPSFSFPNFNRDDFYDKYSKEPTEDSTPGFSKTQLVVITVLSTILVIFVGKYLFFNSSSHTTNHYYFSPPLNPERTPKVENLSAFSQPNNLSTPKTISESYSMIKYITEVEYRKHLSTFYSGVASCSVATYNFLSEIKWRDHTVGFVSFFYESTKSLMIGTKHCVSAVAQFSYPYISAAYSKSTEFCSSTYSYLVGYDWLNAWNKTKEFSMSLVPWGTLGRIKDGAMDLAVKSYRSLFGPSVTETPQGTMGWIKDGCANLTSSSYRSLIGYWSNLWGENNSSTAEVQQSTIEWIKSSCIHFGAKGYNYFAGYDWVYFWSKSKDLFVAWIPWSTFEWLRNNYFNSSFALTCLKTGARATVSSVVYVSQSIYSLVKEK